MSHRTVVQNPSEILRKPSEPVSEGAILSEEIQTLITDMIDSMVEENGIGIAAPQVGVHKRIIIVDDGTGPEAYINPEIISRSFRKGFFAEEGCLSIPGVWGYVTRHKQVKVRALNRHGEEVVVKADNLPSVVFQHEIDHLDGILFIDKVASYSRHPKM